MTDANRDPLMDQIRELHDTMRRERRQQILAERERMIAARDAIDKRCRELENEYALRELENEYALLGQGQGQDPDNEGDESGGSCSEPPPPLE